MKTNKEQQIREHLLQGKSLTQMGAYKLFNHTRLAAVVERMRMQNINVKTEMIHKGGRGQGYARYYVPNHKAY